MRMSLQNDSATLRLALDVLQTISVHMKHPDPRAVLRLRELAHSPYEKSLADDELACYIVHRELARRARCSYRMPETCAA